MAFWVEPKLEFDGVSLQKFNERMMRYAASLNKGMADIAFQWAGRLSEELMRETPPFVGKSASNTADARKKGEGAAKQALLDSVTPASYIFKEAFTSKTLERVVKRKQYEKWTDTTKEMPKLGRWTAKRFTEDLHYSNRPKGRYDYMQEKPILTFDEQKWNRHLRKIQGRVGYLKAGWGVSAAALDRDVPGWISRHLGYAKGSITIDRNPDQPKISMVNSTPTVARFVSRYNYAMDWVGKRMIKQMEFILAAEAKKALKQ